MTDAPDAWIGLDLGTQSVKAVVVSSAGDILAQASRPLNSIRHAPGHHEQSPTQWWDQASASLREVSSVIDVSRVGGIAVCATSGTVVAAEQSAAVPTRLASMYDDTRGAGHVEAAYRVGKDLWDRLGYSPQGSWALPRMAQLVRERAIAPGEHFVTQADVVNRALVGHPVPSDSSHTLKAGVDLDSLEWPEGVLDALGIQATMLPSVVLPGHLLGRVCREAETLTGVPRGTPVIAGMTDGSAAQIAAGCVTNGQWNLVLGTTVVVKGASSTRLPDPQQTIYCHRAPFGGGWWPGGASSTGARAITEFLPDAPVEDLSINLADLHSLDTIYPLVGRGERFPFVAADAEGFVAGSDRKLESANFSEIALGVALIERLCLDAVSFAGYPTHAGVRVTGGGSKNHSWNELRATVLERSLGVPSSTDSAVGMAVLARAAIENPSPSGLEYAASEMVRLVHEVHPQSESVEAARAHYQRFVQSLRDRGWLSEELATWAERRVNE